MADNVEAASGSGGPVFKTDDDGTAHWPYTKIAWGPDDTRTRVNTGAAALPIQDGGNSITIDGTVTAELSAVDNAVLDAIAASLAGTLTVGSHAVTNAGTFAVQAAQSGAYNITNISGTISLPTGAATAAKQPALGTAGTASSDVITVQGITSMTPLLVTVNSALPAGTNAIGKLSANSGVDIGDVDVTSISAGTNLIGDVGISGARTSGGTTIFRSIDLDESEEEVKGSAGQIYWIHATNQATAARYLKVYNATAASVAVGTTTPVLTFAIPTQGDSKGAGFVLSIPNGIAFGTAITVAATTGVADADTGAPGADEVIVNIGYA